MYFVSENIKYLRAKKKLSQNQLAVQLRLTRNQINSYENGNAQPSIEVLQKLAAYFEVNIDTLISIHLNKSTFENLVKFEAQKVLEEKMEERDEISANELSILNISEMFRNFQIEMDKKQELKFV
jgi:transcriptional regulator with XRE-family HTH domain